MSQNYKAVYFPDLPAETSQQKSLTIAFGNKTNELFEIIKDLSSAEIRQLLGTDSYQKICESARNEDLPVNTYCVRTLKKSVRELREREIQLSFPTFDNEFKFFDPLSVTFKGGAKEPFVRWYPYLEGYSPQFVKTILEKYSPNAQVILDPFAGTATTAFTVSQLNKKAYFCEINPVLQFISLTKIRVRKLKIHQREIIAKELIKSIDMINDLNEFEEDYLLNKTFTNTFGSSNFFDKYVFNQILKMRTLIDFINISNPILADLLSIAVLATLVPASRMKRDGDLRYKRADELCEIASFNDSIKEKINQIAVDLKSDVNGLSIDPILICENAQSMAQIPRLNIDTVITSPPYVNGTNYFRNTKIELWFLRCLLERTDLSRFRNLALTAGINDVSNGKKYGTLPSTVMEVVKELEKKSYDSRIPRMIGCYFNEITQIFSAISYHLTSNATIAIDIGDSYYANVHVPADELLTNCLQEIGFEQVDNVALRKRWSRSGIPLRQVLLIFKYTPQQPQFFIEKIFPHWLLKWNEFKKELPHQKPPYSKRNWGHVRHSLCSYPGKMKPSIAYHLVKTFVPDNGSILDPFAGVGTIPFEAALQGKSSYGFDISPAAFAISSAKLQQPNENKCEEIINQLDQFIKSNKPTEFEMNEVKEFGFNGKLIEYYEPKTLGEVILARRYFQISSPDTPEMYFVFASLLHILHGNRPYALSRRSHPMTPYKPTGEYEYRPLVQKVFDKVKSGFKVDLPGNFKSGKMFLQDATTWWPREINDLDAIITSPPFFDSTRYYLANWLRLWFSGWNQQDFKLRPLGFVDERQKLNFDVYVPILRQARERLKPNGVIVFHLGKSVKCDMAAELKKIAKFWFKSADIFDESVTHCESHGIRDKGTVTSHQYLVLY